MKFLLALASLTVGTAYASFQDVDSYFFNRQMIAAGMWAFGPQGVEVYSVDGSELLHKLNQADICPVTTNPWTGDSTDDCSFYYVTTDGHKYVWASVVQGTHRIELFDIDTGDFVGQHPTCNSPIMMDYHATREEMWVRCAGNDPDNGHEGHVDVFSSNSPGTDHEQVVFNFTGRVYGHLAVHSGIGDVGYATVYKSNMLHKFHLSTRDEILPAIEIPRAHAAYDMVYSPTNGHIFFRARVCCTCGSSTADIAQCFGTPSPVEILTGPNAGTTQNGTCSAGCEGSLADTIGVYEFNPKTDEFVGSHNIKEGTGLGADPFVSPDGMYILLAGNDGGKYVRILKAARNGMASKLHLDIPVDFQGGSPGKTVLQDHAFVQMNDMHLVVLTSSVDNKVIVADLISGNTKTLSLSGAEETTADGAREVEWAVGTQYVWVSGPASKHNYVIDLGENLDEATLLRTLTGFPAQKLLYVENYKRSAEQEAPVADAMSALEENDAAKALSIAAIVLSSLALVGFIVVIAGSQSKKRSGEPQLPTDAKSIGSKQVN